MSAVSGSGDEPEITIVTMRFEATNPELLIGVLSKYVVLSRMVQGCRNIDLCQSIATANRFVIVEKWDSPAAQRAHFDSDEMVEMARACEGLLAQPPDIDLLEGRSAYDLS